MKNFFGIIVLLISLSSCEIFVIGSETPIKKKLVVSYNQQSSEGTIMLFQAELDNNNSYSAVDLIANQNGTKMLAYERYEKYYEIERFRRKYSLLPITNIKPFQTSSNKNIKIVEYDLFRNVQYNIIKIDTSWFIVDIFELK